MSKVIWDRDGAKYEVTVVSLFSISDHNPIIPAARKILLISVFTYFWRQSLVSDCLAFYRIF